MKSLTITFCVAFIIGKSDSRATSSVAAGSQQTLNSTSVDGLATPVSLNGTADAPMVSKYANDTTGLNSTSVTNTTAPLIAASALNASSTSLIGDNSTASSSFNSAVYRMSENISWETSNFTIYDKNGTSAYQITNQNSSGNLTANELIVEDSVTGEKKLRINTRVKACGFGQTYEADDGTTFRLDPRAFLPDRWYIRNNSTEYVYKRGALSLEGNIVENERIVAEVSVHRNATEKLKYKQITLTTDGSIPPWDLVALMAVVKTRVKHCGY